MQKGNVDVKDSKNDVKKMECLSAGSGCDAIPSGKAQEIQGRRGKVGVAASGRAKIRPGFAQGKRTTID